MVDVFFAKAGIILPVAVAVFCLAVLMILIVLVARKPSRFIAQIKELIDALESQIGRAHV